MALIELDNTDIIIEVPASVEILGRSYLRSIKIVKLSYELEDKRVQTEAIMRFHEINTDGTIGAIVSTSLVAKSYPIKLIADNGTYCNAADGYTLCRAADIRVPMPDDEDQITGTENDPASPLYGKTYMKEFDWFFNLAQTQPIIINQMIVQFYLRGVENGRFN